MVPINTQYPKIQFTHFVEVPKAECIIGTALDESKRLKLFLIVDADGPIYKRNGINGTWDELGSEKSTVRKLVREALNDSNVPCYSTDGLSVLN